MTETKEFSYLSLPPQKQFEINYNDEITRHCFYYGPSSENDNNYLFGPTKFIAIKPKKLVFADEGIFVYNDENNNAKYKNVKKYI